MPSPISQKQSSGFAFSESTGHAHDPCCSGNCPYAVVRAVKTFFGWPKLTLAAGEEVTELYQTLVVRYEAHWFPYAANETYPSSSCDPVDRTHLDARDDWWEATFECDRSDGKFKLAKLRASCVTNPDAPVYIWQRTTCQTYASASESIIFPVGEPNCSSCQDPNWPTLDCFTANDFENSHFGVGGCYPGPDGLLGADAKPACTDAPSDNCRDDTPTVTANTATHYREETTCPDTSACWAYDVQLSNPVTKQAMAGDVIDLLDLIPLPPAPNNQVDFPEGGPAFPFTCAAANYAAIESSIDSDIVWNGNCVSITLCPFCGGDTPTNLCHTTPNDGWLDDEDESFVCYSRVNGCAGQYLRRPSAWLLASTPTFFGSLSAGQSYLQDFGGLGIAAIGIEAMKSIRSIPDGLTCEFCNEQLWDSGTSSYICSDPDDITCIRSQPISPDFDPDEYIFEPRIDPDTSEYIFGHYYWPEAFNNDPCPCTP